MNKKGFTLVELLVVIMILSLLMGILVPAVARVREQGKTIVCLSRLRQLSLIAKVYTQTYDDYYPPAQAGREFKGSLFITYQWDFTIITDWSAGGKKTIEAGLLWQGDVSKQIQLCPSYKQNPNTDYVEYTGYNYNTSYIGHGKDEAIETPARTIQVRKPSECALFGDGGRTEGANNFMRAPWPSEGDTFYGRWAGAQSYRHSGDATNVAYCDGSAKSVHERYTETECEDPNQIAEGTGFLSADNSAYDLK